MQPDFGKIVDSSGMSLVQESKWLKRKLAENAYTFSEHLDASSRYIAAKAPKVLPTSGVAKSSAAISAVFPGERCWCSTLLVVPVVLSRTA